VIFIPACVHTALAADTPLADTPLSGVKAKPGLVKASDKPTYENEMIRLRLIPRTTDQMAAFFEARGFPDVMINELSRYCFFTVGIKNKSKKVFWLELEKWQFFTGPLFTGPLFKGQPFKGQPFKGQQRIARIPRTQWPAKWAQLQIPRPAQATFRWTLLPERLDFQPDESEGGNIILERSSSPLTLTASFAVDSLGTSRFSAGIAPEVGSPGARDNDTRREIITARIDGLRCAQNQESQ